LVGLEEARTIGYAYGLQEVDGEKTIVTRAFQGRLVARVNRFKPLGHRGDVFPVYEMSFAAPRGLSGSPLLSAQGSIVVHGLMIGNSDSRMLVFASQETVQESRETTRVEHYESLSLGIATQGPFIMSLESRLLGTTIERHLEAQELIA
jgi:hypothetical protein